MSSEPPKKKTKKVSLCTADLMEYRVTSPLGTWTAVECFQGLHSMALPNDENKNNTVVINQPVQAQKGFDDKQLVKWMKQYFERTGEDVALPEVCPSIFQGNSFRQRVWQYIYQNVGVGETLSYGGVGTALGSMKAGQAVGSAMRNNPVPLVIPCHRVIKSGGKVGHYSGGTRDNLKVWLLEHEKTRKT